jgi:replicative DNA helicase
MAYSFSDSIQKGILFLLKSDLDFHIQIANLIRAEYFEIPIYEKIYKIIRRHYEKYKTLISDDIIIEELKRLEDDQDEHDLFEDDIIHINSISDKSFENREYYLDLIEDYAKKQALKAAIRKSVELLNKDQIDGIELEIKKALLISRVIDNGHEYFPKVKDRWKEELKEDGSERFKTVFPSFNVNLQGGNTRKEISMVVAPPGVGKSLYLVNQSVISLMEGRKVLYISLEMSEQKIAQRFDSVITLLPNCRLKDAGIQISLYERLEIFKEKFPGADLFIKEFPTGMANVNTVRALLSQLELYHDFVPDVIIVDYLELLRPTRHIDAEYTAQQRIVEELRGIAVEKNCLVWTATQTNRQGRKVKVITDVELGDSYGKIRPADWVISLNQTEEEYDKGRMRIYVMKARDSKQHYLVGAKVNYINLRIEETALSDEQED